MLPRSNLLFALIRSTGLRAADTTVKLVHVPLISAGGTQLRNLLAGGLFSEASCSCKTSRIAECTSPAMACASPQT